MDHRVCLKQLKKLGATPGSVSLVRAFLEERVMTITIGDHTAAPVKISRGSPQGSVLGYLLYCVTTQLITKNIRASEVPRYFPQSDSDDEDEVAFRGQEGAGSEPGVFLYVDDTTLLDFADLSKSSLHISTARTKQDLGVLELQRDMETINRRAKNIGMKINKKKTQLLIMILPNGCDTSASIVVEGQTVEAIDALKLVGFTFGTAPGAGEHMKVVRSKFRRKVWMLHNLRRAGFKGR